MRTLHARRTSGYTVEAAQRYLEAKERLSVGSELWARATACAFDSMRLKECAKVSKPERWNDEELKRLSARVVRAAPNQEAAHVMRALVLSGLSGGAWEAGPRSAEELMEAAAHFERSAALSNAPAMRAEKARITATCCSRAAAM